MRNYKYYAAQKNSVNTIRLADGSLKFIEGHKDPPLPDWDAIDAAAAAAGSRRLEGQKSRGESGIQNS